MPPLRHCGVAATNQKELSEKHSFSARRTAVNYVGTLDRRHQLAQNLVRHFIVEYDPMIADLSLIAL
jgi:hypothetical protein